MTIRGAVKAVLIAVLAVIAYRCWEVNNRPGPDRDAERVRATLDRMHGDRLERERAAAEEAARDDAAERDRADAEDRAGRARDEARLERAAAEAKEARLREATAAVLALAGGRPGNGITITRSADLPGGGTAFLARQNPFVRDGEEFPGGNVEAYLVEGGAATQVSEARFEWETLAPDDLVEAWADRLFRGEGGPWRVKVLSRGEMPEAAFEAVVTSGATGRRYRLGFAGFTPAGSVELDIKALDE